MQVVSGPSKSAKKKAKKKAAAAKKVDGVENGDAEGLEAAGTKGTVVHSTEANGIQNGESNGTASKQKKSKGMQCVCLANHRHCPGLLSKRQAVRPFVLSAKSCCA